MAENDDDIYHAPNGKGGTGANGDEVYPILPAINISQNLTKELTLRIVEKTNLKRAFLAVKRNKGVPGIDKITISDVEKDLDNVIEKLQISLTKGQYQPLPTKGVLIPKQNGSRQLAIPTVVDRLVQQAIAQVLSPLYDPQFSNFSFGFRPGRSAEQAIAVAKSFVENDRTWAVDIDIEAFFDNVNHDMLMSKLAQNISDKRLLKLIRSFLNAGIMQNGLCVKKDKGTPQGGPLSPLLSNILLHDLDRELSKRRHRFVRYADDFNIYVKSQTAGKRVMESITLFLQKKLKLKVNTDLVPHSGTLNQ